MAERPIIMQTDSIIAICDKGKVQTRRVVKPQPVSVMRCPNVPQDGWSYAHDPEFHEGLAPRCQCIEVKNPYGNAGDHLWVRESWWHRGDWVAHPFSECDDYWWRGVEPVDRTLTDHMSYEELATRKRVYLPDDIKAAIRTGVRYVAHRPEKPVESGYRGLTAKEAGVVWRKRPSIHMPRWASRLTLIIEDVQLQKLRDITPEDALAEGVSSVEEYRKVWDRINRKSGFGWETNPYVWVLTFHAEPASLLMVRDAD